MGDDLAPTLDGVSVAKPPAKKKMNVKKPESFLSWPDADSAIKGERFGDVDEGADGNGNEDCIGAEGDLHDDEMRANNEPGVGEKILQENFSRLSCNQKLDNITMLNSLTQNIISKISKIDFSIFSRVSFRDPKI